MKKGVINSAVAVPIVLLNIFAVGGIIWLPFGIFIAPVFLVFQSRLLWNLRKDTGRIVLYGIGVPAFVFVAGIVVGHV